MLKVSEASKRANITQVHIRKLIARKVLKAKKIGRLIYLPEPEVEHIIKVQESLPKDAIPIKEAARMFGIKYKTFMKINVNEEHTKAIVNGIEIPVYCDISGYRYYMSKADITKAIEQKNNYYTLAEAAKLLGISIETIRKNTYGKKDIYVRIFEVNKWYEIKLVRIGKKLHIKKEDIRMLLDKKMEYLPFKEVKKLLADRNARYLNRKIEKDGEKYYLKVEMGNKKTTLELKKFNKKYYVEKSQFSSFYHFIKERRNFLEDYIKLKDLVKKYNLKENFFRDKIKGIIRGEKIEYYLIFARNKQHKIYFKVIKIDGCWVISKDYWNDLIGIIRSRLPQLAEQQSLQ